MLEGEAYWIKGGDRPAGPSQGKEPAFGDGGEKSKNVQAAQNVMFIFYRTDS